MTDQPSRPAAHRAELGGEGPWRPHERDTCDFSVTFGAPRRATAPRRRPFGAAAEAISPLAPGTLLGALGRAQSRQKSLRSDPSKPAGIKAAALESFSRSRRGRDPCVRASRPAPSRRPARSGGPASRGFRTGSPYDASSSARKHGRSSRWIVFISASSSRRAGSRGDGAPIPGRPIRTASFGVTAPRRGSRRLPSGRRRRQDGASGAARPRPRP